MSSIVIDSVTGPDGTLRLDVPMGHDRANQAVRVVIESVPKPITQAEYVEWVRFMGGRWQGDFERPPQLPLEERKPL